MGRCRPRPIGPTGSDEIAGHALEALAGRRAALLACHGALTVGATPADALLTAQVLERQAQLAWLLRGPPR